MRAPCSGAAIRYKAGLLDVGEERLHRIEILRQERIELVVVAFRAAHRAAQPDGAERAHAVGAVLGEIFLRLETALRRGAVQTIVGRRDAFFERRVRQQVSGDLLACELVERFVVRERAEHVIAIGPGGDRVVSVEAAGIGIPHRVEPVHRALLGITR